MQVLCMCILISVSAVCCKIVAVSDICLPVYSDWIPGEGEIAQVQLSVVCMHWWHQYQKVGDGKYRWTWHTYLNMSTHDTYLLIYLLTPWSRVLPEKLTGSAASQDILRTFGTRIFITVLTSARHLSLSWAKSIQSPQPPPTSWRSIIILSFHLCLRLRNSLLPLGFPTRTLCTPLLSPIRATCRVT